MVAFLTSVGRLHRVLSQQNFDSQWISTPAKDALNTAGIGAFDGMDFGQMLLWHVVLLPIVLVAIVGAHVLLVRYRGVSQPLPAHLGGPGSANERRKAQKAADAAPWRGPTRRYDIVKEGTIASLVVLGLTVLLAALLSSPDVPSATVKLDQDRAGRLRGHRRHRTQRHQRHRRLRPPLQQCHRRHPESAVRASPRSSASPSRSTPPRTSSSARCPS